MDKLELAKIKKGLNWSDIYIEADGKTSIDWELFEISPEQFLQYAKEDYRNSSERDLVNCITNAKRAIDCQTDWILQYLGFEHQNFNDKKYPVITQIIQQFEQDRRKCDPNPIKLKFVQSMEIAPTFLISKIREVRNKIEHEYKMPSQADAIEAVELAELYINATQNMMFYTLLTDYYIRNERLESGYLAYQYISIRFSPSYQKSRITINMRELEQEIKLDIQDLSYLYLMKAALTHDFGYLKEAFDLPIPKEDIIFKIGHC